MITTRTSESSILQDFSNDLLMKLELCAHKLTLLQELMASLSPELMDINVRDSILLLIESIIEDTEL